jgi:hypothetical protein
MFYMTMYTECKINPENRTQLALASVSRGVGHCIAEHFSNAVQRSAKLPGRLIRRPFERSLRFLLAAMYLAWCVCVMDCNAPLLQSLATNATQDE